MAVFEVDGLKNPVYCENLGLLSKLFLDHKNLEWDMSIFLFYILCEIKDNEYHMTGYFSKVTNSFYKLTAKIVNKQLIMHSRTTLPSAQRLWKVPDYIQLRVEFD